MIDYMRWRWGFWIRVCGYGFAVGIDRPKLFSERYGYKKVYRVRLSLEFLGRNQ